MTDTPENADSAPSRVLPAVAATLPIVFTMVACGLYGIAGSATSNGLVRGFQIVMEEMGGPALLLVIAGTATGTIGAAIAIFLAGRGVRVPAAAPVLLASLPWLAGLLGARMGMGMAWAAVAHVDVAFRSALMAQGIAEATSARLLGAIMASGILASVAIGLALGALAQRAPERSPVGALIGGGLALPLLGLALYGFAATHLAGAALVVTGLGVVFGGAIAGAGIGADEPHGRSGALGAAAPVAGGLALLAAAVATTSMSTKFAFRAIAMVEPGDMTAVLAESASHIIALAWPLRWALPVGLVGAAGLAGWAAMRSKPSAGRVAGGVALVATALAVWGADIATMNYAEDRLSELGDVPWLRIEGLEPVTVLTSNSGAYPDRVLGLTGMMRPGGAAVGAELGEATRELAREAAERRIPIRLDEGLPAPPFDFRAEPELTIVLDRRVDAPALRIFFGALAQGGVRSLELLGARPGEDRSDESRARVRDAFPLLMQLVGGSGSVRTIVGGSVPPERSRDDRVLRHVTVGASVPARIEVRPDAALSERELRLDPDPSSPAEWSPDPRPLYIVIGDGATAQSLVATCDAATANGLTPVVVVGEVPGLRLAEPTANPPGLPTVVPPGDVEARGSLDREVIREVIRRHVNEVRFCYERELARDPSLAGRVVTHFVVSPTGAVRSAEVQSSTLESPPVEACLTRAIERWRFPAPSGGGIVVVIYPFIFSASG